MKHTAVLVVAMLAIAGCKKSNNAQPSNLPKLFTEVNGRSLYMATSPEKSLYVKVFSNGNMQEVNGSVSFTSYAKTGNYYLIVNPNLTNSANGYYYGMSINTISGKDTVYVGSATLGKYTSPSGRAYYEMDLGTYPVVMPAGTYVDSI